MAVKELERFTATLKNWVTKNPAKRADLCNIVGIKFSEAGINPSYRNEELYGFLNAKTQYTTTSDLHNVIHAGKQSSKGRIETHIALYYLAIVDHTYNSYVEDIEIRLFGEGRTFHDVFGWSPNKDYTKDSNSCLEQNQAGPYSGPRLRLRPPGVHSHSSHFSNRAIKEVIGRDPEKETLRRFAGSEPGFRWVQLAGAGGQGKSRMAYDLMGYVGDDWERGFLNKPDLEEFQGSAGQHRPDAWRDWKPTKPHLIIVDYIIGRELDIGFALDQIAERRGEFNVPICVLLLERQRWDRGALAVTSANEKATTSSLASREGPAWWFTKLNRNRQNDLKSDLLRFEAGVIELTELSPNSLLTIVRMACPREKEINHTDDFIKSSLSNIDKSGRPLFAYFLSQALSDGQFSPNWTQSNLLEYIFDEHCRKRWDDSWGLCPTLSSNHSALRLALLATLVRFVDCRNLPDNHYLGNIGEDTRQQALALTGGPMGGSRAGIGNIIPALEPDILGEWFVLTAIEENPSFKRLIHIACDYDADGFEETLIKIAQDFPNHNSTYNILECENVNESAMPYFGGAMFLIGVAYFDGILVNKDYERAAFWFKKAATCGDPHSMYNLGVLYTEGNGVKKSLELAFDCYSKAADGGDNYAMFNLGICYEVGEGVARNEPLAFYWYHKAAVLGDERAMHNLGKCYENGFGTDENPEKAFEWFEKSAELGDSGGMMSLAGCYEDGYGVQENEILAKEWYVRCANAGNISAVKILNTYRSECPSSEESINPFQALRDNYRRPGTKYLR